jgi:DNA repair photolyase
MTLIYTPNGRAREYAALALNPYIGCDHCCKYCYAPSALQQTRDSFASPRIRPNYFINLEKEAAKLVKPGDPVPQILLAFATDPYCHYEQEQQVTSRTLQVLNRHGLSYCVLTKGGTRALADLALFKPRDSFATTMTFINPAKSLEWEPGAALPDNRMAALDQFYRHGIETWISLEPVLEPAETLQVIRETYAFTDLYKIGKINHHPLEKVINWAEFGTQAVELLEKLGKQYYVKDDLAAFGFETGPNRVSREWIEERHMSRGKKPVGQIALF